MSGSLSVRVLACLLLLPAVAAAGEHPIETELRGAFPSLSLRSSAAFDAADAVVGGRAVSGFQARFTPQTLRTTTRAGEAPQRELLDDAPVSLRMHYPRSYDDAFVVEMNGQRLVLRAVGASAAFAVETGGKLLYERPYPFTELLEVPDRAASEQLLLVHDRRAPRLYEWEIVETQGIAGVVLDDGALRFLSTTQPAPTPRELAAGRFSQAPVSLRIARPSVIDAGGRRSETAARWTLVGGGRIPGAIRLTLSDEALSFPRVVEACFCGTGSMAGARNNHTATLLPSGKVLMVGGRKGNDFLASAELYDPATGQFSSTGSLGIARSNHTATLLGNGKVLVAGGQNESGFTLTAELYDPVAGTFTPTGSPSTVRDGDSATLLGNGKVLLRSYDSAELYDPATGTFSVTGPPLVTRTDHTATLLPNGKVLLAGGFFFNNLSSAELYDPGTGTFSATGSLGTARFEHSATLLSTGKVLIAAGYDSPNGTLASAELYDPSTGTFSATGSLENARYLHTATLLPNGMAILAGGAGADNFSSTELYDPIAGTFSAGPEMGVIRLFHTATLLPNGQILMAAGFGIASAELYHPDTGSFSPTGNLGAARVGQTATLLPNAKVLIAGGYGSGDLNSAELYDATAGTFTGTGNLGTARGDHTATLLQNGKVLIVGGTECCFPVTFASAELYDPGLGTFSGTGSLAKARSSHTATLLPNGKVLIAGGWDRNVGEIVATAELYDPVAGTFSGTGSMGTARSTHTATLLANGKVLIAGGENFVSGSLDSAELYDPNTGTFSATGNLVATRNSQTATLLPNGKVLLAAGTSSHTGCCLNTAELYDPATGTFSATGDLTNGRTTHTATLLPTGEVLIVGGLSGDDAIAAAEIYDVVSGHFQFTGNPGIAREWHTATLLTNGKVLIAGGNNFVDGSLGSAELYEGGLGFSEARRPVIGSSPATQAQPGTMALSGTGFRGDSEASSGTTDSSNTNYPLLQLQRIDNDQTLFVRSSVAWSATSFTSATLGGLPGGHYRVTIFVNGIPSVQRLVSFVDPGPPPQISIDNVTVTEGNAGTTMATFTVSLSAAGGDVTVHYATADGTATSTGLASANPAPIDIPVGSAASPYPSTINVAGVTGTITKVTATLTGLAHTFPRDLDVLLVGPGGQSVVLMSDPGSGDGVTGVNLTFDDAAADPLPSSVFVSGTYKPTNIEDGDGLDFYEPPAPSDPYGSTLSVFNTTSPNGIWSLYVVDDFSPSDAGSIAGGWSLTFTTTSSDYSPTSGLVTIPMGSTSATISVPVHGDTVAESNETFFVNLSNPGNATILDGQGQGTINNDDNPAAPPNVVAAATGSTSVTVNWTAAPGATSYRVYRGARSGGVITYSLIGSPSGTTLNDNAVSAGTSYLYKVRSFFTSESGDSNIDLATTVLFTDPTLVAGTTKAKLAHFTELLTAVNAVRALAGLGAAAFTAPTPTTAVTVRRQHLLDLRTGINAARSTLALAALSYTDPTITAGSTTIKAAHITELRSGVQ